MSVEDLGIVVTATDIYLVEENHFYPLAPGKNKKSVKGQQQFIPKGHRKISDISGLVRYPFIIFALCSLKPVCSSLAGGGGG